MNAPALVLFDGLCTLCHRSVRFVVANDPGRHFRFASLDSGAARDALARFGRTPEEFSSVVLVDGGHVYERSDAALRIARSLRAPWPAFAALLAFPRALRDAAYDVVARNRNRLFGRTTTCPLPDEAAMAGRFA
ncbi:MAG: thiol-disulfide oxidoreductase DCC family protein [Vulcanimicrobiaceae bacterium]